MLNRVQKVVDVFVNTNQIFPLQTILGNMHRHVTDFVNFNELKTQSTFLKKYFKDKYKQRTKYNVTNSKTKWLQ